jgi:hypothetical protein
VRMAVARQPRTRCYLDQVQHRFFAEQRLHTPSVSVKRRSSENDTN